MKITYFISNPELIACTRGTVDTVEPTGTFESDVSPPVSQSTHKIVWSGKPGEGNPLVIRKTEADIIAEKLDKEKGWALQNKLDKIDIQRKSLDTNDSLFMFRERYIFMDRETFLSYKVRLPELPDDFSINWKTADKEQNGVENIYLSLDKKGLEELISAAFTHSDTLYTVAELHKKAVKKIRLKTKSTVADIENYDHTTGWR